MSEGGDHESWDDEMMMNENNETPLPVVRMIRLPFNLQSSIFARFLTMVRSFAAIVHVQG